MVIRETEPRSRDAWGNQCFRNPLVERMPQATCEGSVWREAKEVTHSPTANLTYGLSQLYEARERTGRNKIQWKQAVAAKHLRRLKLL